ncbi:MAG: DUF4129 domain-containing protein [Chloroflexi bacterium]|nr:DUF4129 domain-containing protein [Chloroflexota bacterium]
MSGRAFATEAVALTALALWIYGGAALLVAAMGDGAALSFGAVAAVVVLSYGLSLALSRFDVDIRTLRLWGAALSLALLYLVLRVEIAGEPYLWELGWLGDLLSSPGDTLQGRAGDVTAVVVLSGAWMWGVVRGSRDLSFELILGEAGLGVVAVLFAAAFASGADAPEFLLWLPAPYLAAALFALALAHLRQVDLDRRRPFLDAWGLWTGGSLAAIGGIATLAALFDPSSLALVGDGIVLLIQGLALAIAVILVPPILAIAWLVQLAFGWLATGEAFMPEPAGTGELLREVDEEADDPARWTKILAYVLGGGIIALIAAAMLAALWLAFARSQRTDERPDEVREVVEPEGAAGGVRSLIAGALGRLRGRASPARGRDAIGGLYLEMLSDAEARGLARPASATPQEFAPQLEALFQSATPGAISRTYMEARYARRPPAGERMRELRDEWRRIDREPSGG